MPHLYHNNLIHSFLENVTCFYSILGFLPQEYRTHKEIGLKNCLRGEIDIILYFNGLERALIEAKSKRPPGKIQENNLEKQMRFYSSYNPNAELFLLFGSEDNSLNPKEFTLERYISTSRDPSH